MFSHLVQPNGGDIAVVGTGVLVFAENIRPMRGSGAPRQAAALVPRIRSALRRDACGGPAAATNDGRGTEGPQGHMTSRKRSFSGVQKLFWERGDVCVHWLNLFIV